MLSSLALRTSSATAMRMCVRRGGAHHASSSSSSSSSLRLAVPRRGFADAPRKPSFLGRILWGTQGTEEDQQQQQQQQEQEQQKPLSPETTTKSTVDVSKATSKKADTSAKTTAATSTSNVSSSSTSSEANSNFMNADFEKLGREALEDGTPESENLAKAVSAGAFTMNEFLTVLRKTPKAMMPADKRKETEDSIRLLEAMTEVQRKNNVLLNHKVMAVLGPQLAKKAGVPGDTPSRVSLHFQVTETIMRCVRKWKENGESIPTTMEGLQQKALADGSLNHLLKGMKRFQ